MPNFFKSSVRLLFSVLLLLVLSACSSGVTSGLEAFKSPNGRYGFFYPTGWTRVAVSGGPEVVFHDLINSDETLSLVVSELSSDIGLESLGSPENVGARLIENVIAPEGSGRTAQLIDANERETGGRVFYNIEYSLKYQNRDRHELATVVTDHGSLYTLAAGTNEARWSKVDSLFEKVINSFTFFI